MHAHEFAVYYPEIFSGDITITDKFFIHRLYNILRLNEQDSIVLFNHDQHASATIQKIESKKIKLHVDQVQKNEHYKPSLCVALGLLKREALERAVEELTAIGVNDIVLYVSEKVQRKWGGEKERERLQRLIVAAAEQSKNFAYPLIQEPVVFNEIINHDALKIWCDVGGEPLTRFICSQVVGKPIQVVIGPEADLTDQEKDLLKDSGYITCQLTPTVLRAYQAATLAAGIIRSA